MLNPQIATAVEKLDYRVTIGDVAAQAGLEINQTQAGLLALASDVSAHLQVAETGDITYVFPKNFRAILRNKYFRIRLQEAWNQLWTILFFLIRISFGIFLLLSIALIFISIAIIVFAYTSSQEDNRGGNSRRGDMSFFPSYWISDLWWWFSFNPGHHSSRLKASQKSTSSLNFFEAVFSVLFGDGNPNAELEEKRWQTIGQVIRKHQGAVIAEQVMPYLDLASPQTDEDFMIPVLSRFNGYPKVSETGHLIYRFPELQTTARHRDPIQVSDSLQEQRWKFTQAGSGQVLLTLGLGGLNLIGGAMLFGLLQDPAIVVQLGGIVAFVSSILWLLLAYGIGFLAIPLGRYFWIQAQNQKIAARNTQRMTSAIAISRPQSELQQKLALTQAYRQEVVLSDQDLAYTTERDLLDQSFDPLSSDQSER